MSATKRVCWWFCAAMLLASTSVQAQLRLREAGSWPAPTRLFATEMVGSKWGWEVGYVDTGRLARFDHEGRASGLNLSLVGRSSFFGSALGVYGKVGTTYARAETSVTPGVFTPASEQAFGLAMSAGLSYAFNRRLSATFELDSADYKFTGGRDPVRSANLGLQLRY